MISAACGYGPTPEPVRPTDAGARETRSVLYFGDRTQWERTPWFRVTEDLVSWPRRVVLASDGCVCLMPDTEVIEPRRHEYHRCTTRWRLPRVS